MKRILALLLALTMVLSMVPVTVLAAESVTPEPLFWKDGEDYINGVDFPIEKE